MPRMNTGQARVVDPVLTTLARQYRNADMVLEKIFPYVPVQQRGGRVIKFTKDSFRVYNTRRAPGAATKRIEVGYESERFALHHDSLEAVMPIEIGQESGAVVDDLGALGVATVLDSLMLGTEQERADLATDAASYGASNKLALTGTDQWSDPTADLLDQVNTGREQVRAGVGHRANKLVLSPAAELAAMKNNAIRDQFKYTSGESITRDMLARYFQVDEVIVPMAVRLADGAAESAEFTDVWGNFGLLCYVPPSVRGRHVPSFGYSYRLDGYPMVEQTYYDKPHKSDITPVTLEERPYLTAPEAGYLFTNIT